MKDELEDIQDLESCLTELQAIGTDNLEQTLNVYQELLTKYDGTEYIGQIAFQYALVLHSICEEELALELFRKSYEEGYNCDVTLDILKEDFWYPNAEEFKQTYLKNVRGTLQEKLAFSDLNAIFFPVSDEKFMMYDTAKKQFLGWISMEQEVLKEKNAYSDRGTFSVLKDIASNQIQALLQEGFQYVYRTIYIMVNTDRDDLTYETLCSLYMIPNIREKCLQNIYFIFDINVFVECVKNYHLYLPKYILLDDEILKRDIESIVEQLHQERIHNKSGNPKPLLTIGIPTYNRGERARKLVQCLLDMPYDYELQYVVSNNGSNDDVEEYRILSEIEDSRYTYFEFEYNHQYYGNVAKVAKLSKGMWLMYLSDEDAVIEKELNFFLEKLLLFRNDVSMIRVGSSLTYADLEFDYWGKGLPALEYNAFENNYLSGQVYNRCFLTDELVDKLEKQYINNIGYQVYIHLIYDLCMGIKGACVRYPLILIEEGESISVVSETGQDGYSYAQYDARIEQWQGYVDIINSWDEFSDEERVWAYLLACVKTFFLIGLRKEIYQADPDWSKRKEDLTNRMVDGYDNLPVSDACCMQNRKWVYGNIMDAMRRYLD
jgi:glycosyltransferase involved in cell wall biosynthesis